MNYTNAVSHVNFTVLFCSWKAQKAVYFHVVHSLWGGLETGRCCFGQRVNPLDTLWCDGSVKCKHTQSCTHTKSLFSFLRGRALVQGWPLYHNKLIRFASLHLSLSICVCSLHQPPFMAPLNSRSQTFVLSIAIPASSFDCIYFTFFKRTPGSQPVL